MTNVITKKQLFNPDGNDSIEARRVIKGNTTNLFNLNETRYTWAKNFYRVMLANHWIPEKVDMSSDIQEFKELSETEKEVFRNIISFLTFLDSIQTNNLPNIADYITAPEIRSLIGIQEFQEIIHSQSYAYILESVIPKSERDAVYEKWKTNPDLMKRNKYIADIYQSFINSPDDNNLSDVLIANFILESIYFYNGFTFFYNLAAQNKMLGTADQIRYIHRDEATHVNLFAMIIQEVSAENPGFFNEERVHGLFCSGVEQEIQWSRSIFNNKIIGLEDENIEEYTKYLADNSLKMIGLSPMYNINENPYRHLGRISDVSGNDIKSNFFEATVTNYSQSSAITGWDDF